MADDEDFVVALMMLGATFIVAAFLIIGLALSR